MKKFVCLFLLVALAALCAAPALAVGLDVTVTNKTDAKIFIALAAVSGDGGSDNDYSRGWYGVGAGKTVTIKLKNYSLAYEYGYYATSKGGKRVWAGSAKASNILGTFWIHPTKAFSTHPDNPISGGKQVNFRRMGVDSSGKVKLTLTAK